MSPFWIKGGLLGAVFYVVPFTGASAFILRNTQSLACCMISLTFAWVMTLCVLGLTHSSNKPLTMNHFPTSYGLGTSFPIYYLITTIKDLKELQGQEMT